MLPRLFAMMAALLFVPAGLLAAHAPKANQANPSQTARSRPRTVAYLGVAVEPVSPAIARQANLPRGLGLLVGQVSPNTPAAKAGIRRGDVLTRFNQQMLIDNHQFRTIVWMQKPGDKVKLTYYRDGKQRTVSLKLGKIRPAREMDNFGRGMPEMPMRWMTPQSFWDHGMSPNDQGRSMMETRPQKPARPKARHQRKAQPARPAPAKAKVAEPAPRPAVAPAKPAPKSQNAVTINISTPKYVVTVNTNKGREFATVKTADGKTICKNLPQTKWKKLPAKVRSLLDEVHVNNTNGGEQINVPA